ncbi:MAG: hypothetical protein WKF43_14905 [Acidimicrobiales bacterium]
MAPDTTGGDGLDAVATTLLGTEAAEPIGEVTRQATRLLRRSRTAFARDGWTYPLRLRGAQPIGEASIKRGRLLRRSCTARREEVTYLRNL